MPRSGLADGDDALEAALSALRGRDFGIFELDARLESRGFGDAERARVVETLLRTGVLDDGRFAEGRAATLARRGAGDALIRHALSSAGIAEEYVERALAALEPESERARAIVARRGPGAKTARYLRAKGFAEDVVGAVAAGRDEGVG